MLLFAALLFAPQLLNDGDTMWQIRTGEWMLSHHAVPFADPFSYTMAGRPWPPHQWLGQLMLGVAFRAGGWSAVSALAAASAALTFGLLIRHLRHFLHWLPALFLAIVGFSLVAPSLLARPHLLALPCLEGWCAVLVIARSRKQAPPFWLLAVMALWANLHASFPAGLVLVMALTGEAVIEQGSLRDETVRRWLAFAALALAAACLTPQGPAGLLFPLRHLGMKSLANIDEWRPTDFGSLQPLELAIMLALYVGLSGQVRLPRLRVLLFLALLHEALAHSRNGQLVGLFGPLLLAESIGRSLIFIPQRRDARPQSVVARGAVTLMAAILLAVRLTVPSSGPAVPAAAALAQVPDCLRVRPVLNDYRFGPYLILTGVAPFVDSRAELYGDAFLSEYAHIASGDPAALDAALQHWQIAWALLAPGHAAIPLLERNADWQRVYQDHQAVLLTRRDGGCTEVHP